MKRLYIKFLFIAIVSLIIVNSTGAAIGGIYGEPPQDGAAVLQVLKWASDDEITLGAEITVFVNITNWSDYDAFNLTIDEPIFSNWSITEFVGYDEYVFTKIAAGSSIYYQYTMKLINDGNYTIEPTVVNYVDINSTQFMAKSSYIPLLIITEEAKKELSDYWNDIFLMAAIFVLIPIAIRLLYKYKNK